jgi:hypothetical protein
MNRRIMNIPAVTMSIAQAQKKMSFKRLDFLAE